MRAYTYDEQMLVNHYKIPLNPKIHENAKAGHLVFNDDGVAGFIDFVSDTSIAIYLFSPMEVTNPKIEVINDGYNAAYRLMELIKYDAEIARIWHRLAYPDLTLKE